MYPVAVRPLCQQHVMRACVEPAEWSCSSCRKPVCSHHRYFCLSSERGNREWRYLCTTCFTLEQRIGKPIAKISLDERAHFLRTPTGRHLTGPWDVAASSSP